MHSVGVFWIIALFMYVIFAAIIFGLLYLCIKFGVKQGIMAAYREIEKEKKDKN